MVAQPRSTPVITIVERNGAIQIESCRVCLDTTRENSFPQLEALQSNGQLQIKAFNKCFNVRVLFDHPSYWTLDGICFQKEVGQIQTI